MKHTLMSLTVAASLTAACLADSSAAPTGPSQVVAPGTTEVRKIVALGDSLTSGRGLQAEQAYPSVLNGLLREASLPFTVINHGVSGDTTTRAVRRLQAALDENPSILIVALGANDGLRGVPVAEMRRNLETIIEAAQARNIAVLLCGMDALPINGWQYTIDFHNVFPELAARYKVPLVPFLLDGVFLNEQMVQPDFVHPNAAGAAQIARNLWPYLQPMTAALLSRQ
jgi:acyl-CoA thioesterase-1